MPLQCCLDALPRTCTLFRIGSFLFYYDMSCYNLHYNCNNNNNNNCVKHFSYYYVVMIKRFDAHCYNAQEQNCVSVV